jgi:hypothetical protein
MSAHTANDPGKIHGQPLGRSQGAGPRCLCPGVGRARAQHHSACSAEDHLPVTRLCSDGGITSGPVSGNLGHEMSSGGCGQARPEGGSESEPFGVVAPGFPVMIGTSDAVGHELAPGVVGPDATKSGTAKIPRAVDIQSRAAEARRLPLSFFHGMWGGRDLRRRGHAAARNHVLSRASVPRSGKWLIRIVAERRGGTHREAPKHPSRGALMGWGLNMTAEPIVKATGRRIQFLSGGGCLS